MEQFCVLLLNRAHKILGFYKHTVGGTTGTLADPRLIFAAAIKSNASNIILCHNHPSGNPKPSDADRLLTQKLKKAGELLEIRVLDHIIITAETYYSFSDEGLM